MLTLEEFNRRFLSALENIPVGVRDTGSGSNRRHPLLRSTLIMGVRSDIETFGLKRAVEKWQHFIDNPLPSKQIVEPKPKGIRGRKRLNIPLILICDTLQREKDITAAAVALGCSQAYIYREVGVRKIQELVKDNK